MRKHAGESAVLRRLRSFLDKNEPELVYFLVTLWRAQGKAITYRELRQGILEGELSPQMLAQWQQDYTRLVKTHMEPAWNKAIEAAAQEVQRAYPRGAFDPMSQGLRSWVEAHGAAFVTSCTQTQLDGLRAVIRRAALLDGVSVDTLARAIRPMVGLYHQQSVANLNYFQTLLEQGMAEKRALDLSIRYGARQHRYRGYLIARTELAFAYNQGSYEGTKQAQQAGYLGEVQKIWCTADDERVCPICGTLEGKQAAMEEDFPFPTKLAGKGSTLLRVPPAHPSCRCAVLYREVPPPGGPNRT